MEKIKALVLMSGGLDSMLAARVLLEQGVEVVGLSFISNFFNAEKAFEATKKLNIPLIAFNIADQHLEMVKKPKHGHGKNMNPCIDCHGMMLAQAKEIMEGKEVVFIYPNESIKAVAQTYDFVATGEVLGQRPMSQTSHALKIVEKISGLDGALVRPLSAQLLPETKPVKEGKIQLAGLLNINGRGRERQVALAAEYGLKDYPSPGGGCILTDQVFGEKLRELFDNWPVCNSNDAKLIKVGRNFWLHVGEDKYLLEIGRDETENDLLLKLAQKGDAVIEVAEVLGPVALLRYKGDDKLRDDVVSVQIPREVKVEKLNMKIGSLEDVYDMASLIVGYYAKQARGHEVKVNFKIK